MKTPGLLITLLLLIAGCSTNSPTAPPPQTATAPNPEVAQPPVVRATQFQKPEAVVKNMNRNYDTIKNDCAEFDTHFPRGHYYCSGVLFRGVNDGNYDPWTYSPHAVATGATSWSWARRDAGVQTALYGTGMLLRNRVDAINAGVPGLDNGLICLFPFDAGTGPESGHNGCGLDDMQIPVPYNRHTNAPPPLRNGNTDAWGLCPVLRVTNATQWEKFYKVTNGRQCSWNVESQAGWNAMLAIRKHAGKGIYNELMLKNQDEGQHMPQYIAAFFYAPGSTERLAAARSFQTKLFNAGYIVPILRMDLSKPTSPFSYDEADQAIKQ